MPKVRDILNRIKWTKDLKKVEIWYFHRGALHNTKIVTGSEISGIGRSFLETTSATIPYHRITKIIYGDITVFNRWDIQSENKQL
jgi:uncharacterized protein (UPF0248 family)